MERCGVARFGLARPGVAVAWKRAGDGGTVHDVALITCPDCHTQISSAAKICPTCGRSGASIPGTNDSQATVAAFKLIGYVLIFAVLVGILSAIGAR